MAEKETDESLENNPLDLVDVDPLNPDLLNSDPLNLSEGSLNIAPKTSSKSILIKIIIGLLALLITGGIYLLFMSSDNEPTTLVENASDINDTIILPETTLPATTSESVETKDEAVKPTINKLDSAEYLELLKMRKETATLKEENLKIKEQLKALELKLANLVKADKKTDQKTAKPAVKIKSPNDLLVGNELLIRPPTQAKQAKAVKTPEAKIAEKKILEAPPPEPKWGDFDPLYSGY